MALNRTKCRFRGSDADTPAPSNARPPTAVAICRSLSLASALSRRTSLILRVDNLACATVALPSGKDRRCRLSRSAYSLDGPVMKYWPGIAETPARHAVKPRPGLR